MNVLIYYFITLLMCHTLVTAFAVNSISTLSNNPKEWGHFVLLD